MGQGCIIRTVAQPNLPILAISKQATDRDYARRFLQLRISVKSIVNSRPHRLYIKTEQRCVTIWAKFIYLAEENFSQMGPVLRISQWSVRFCRLTQSSAPVLFSPSPNATNMRVAIFLILTNLSVIYGTCRTIKTTVSLTAL